MRIGFRLSTACHTLWTGSVDNPVAQARPSLAPLRRSCRPDSSDLSAKLIFPTKEIVEEFYLPIIYTACRTCYSELVPDKIWDKAVSREVADEKQQSLVRKVMESGHGSTIEHVNFTFAISGVTRTLSHQLVRHRAGTAFDQQTSATSASRSATTTPSPTASPMATCPTTWPAASSARSTTTSSSTGSSSRPRCPRRTRASSSRTRCRRT